MAHHDDQVRAIFGNHLPRINVHGRMIFDPVWAERMHMPHACELLFIIKGEMTLQFETKSFHASVGDALLVPPGTLHRDNFDIDTELDLFYLSFTWNLESEFTRFVNNDTIQAIPEDKRLALAMLFEPLRQECGAINSATQVLAEARLYTILMFLLREATDQNQSGESSEEIGARGRVLLREAKKYLNNHYAECVSLNEIAARLKISACHLSHVFSREEGFSMFAYLTQIRIEKAKLLLHDPSLQIAEVSLAVGYEDANYFAKVFKKNVGLSPRAFSAVASK